MLIQEPKPPRRHVHGISQEYQAQGSSYAMD